MDMKEEEFEKIAHSVATLVTGRYMGSILETREKQKTLLISEFYTEAYLLAKMQARKTYQKLNSDKIKDDFDPIKKSDTSSPFKF